MSYQLYDIDGYCGDVASNSGILKKSAATPASSKELKSLFEDGKLEGDEQIKAAATQAKALGFDALAEALGKAKEVAIISDGVVEAAAEEQPA